MDLLNNDDQNKQSLNKKKLLSKSKIFPVCENRTTEIAIQEPSESYNFCFGHLVKAWFVLILVVARNGACNVNKTAYVFLPTATACLASVAFGLALMTAVYLTGNVF
uniref:Uncharacterized protein n=1 Tax=Glossina palpalis gambiensis TaxID=67801 RepID=A0A1B0B542_9MUSC